VKQEDNRGTIILRIENTNKKKTFTMPHTLAILFRICFKNEVKGKRTLWWMREQQGLFQNVKKVDVTSQFFFMTS
jgi:hypothetical protein